MLRDYDLVRWEMYLRMIADDLDGKVQEPQCFADMETGTIDFEERWAQGNGPEFPAKPAGEVFSLSQALFDKYADLLRPAVPPVK